jgi:hypothetical protein
MGYMVENVVKCELCGGEYNQMELYNGQYCEL